MLLNFNLILFKPFADLSFHVVRTLFKEKLLKVYQESFQNLCFHMLKGICFVKTFQVKICGKVHSKEILLKSNSVTSGFLEFSRTFVLKTSVDDCVSGSEFSNPSVRDNESGTAKLYVKRSVKF